MKEGYFLKDTALVDKGNDAFHHNDYVKNIKKIIEEHEPPFNIALIGKWGVGKSSIINLLKKELDGKPEYKVHEINAWKYENDSLKRAFLKNLWKKLNEDKDISFLKQFRNSFREGIMQVTMKDEPLTFWQTLKALLPLMGVLVSMFLLSSAGFLAIFYTWDFVNTLFTDNTFKENSKDTFSSFKKNIWAPIIIAPLFKMFQDFFKSSMQTKMADVKLINPIETADEYEDLFKEEIANYKKSHPEFRKLVVIVDDLDRLSAKKVVAALDAIKAFVDVDECIFIVTCDENILINALEKEKLNQTTEYIDGELFLDKLFHFRMPLPPIIESDMKKYSIDLAKQQAPALVKLCKGQFDEIVDILIHAEVTTPRQVKKLLNTFSNNLLIAKAREDGNRKLESKLLTEEDGLRFLAKLSVLQADYNDVYLELVKDFYFLDDILNCYQQGDPGVKKIKSSVKVIFDNKGSHLMVNPQYEGLINFLISTQHINAENLAPFIYLAQDAVGLIAGDEKQRNIRKNLVSGNEKGIIGVLEQEDNPGNIALAIIDYVRNVQQKDLPLVIKTAFQLIEHIPIELKRDLANSISYRLTIAGKASIRLWQIEPKNLVTAYLKADNKKGIEKSLLVVIEELFNKSENWKTKLGREMTNDEFIYQISSLLDTLLAASENLPTDIINKVKEFLWFEEEKYSFYPFSEYLDLYKEHKSLFYDYFDIEFYNQLVSYMKEKDNDDWEECVDVFNEIAPDIRDRHTHQFIRSVPSLITVAEEELIIDIVRLTEPVLNEIYVNRGTEIVNSIASAKFKQPNNFIEVTKFLQQIKFRIEDEEQLEELDNFVVRHFPEEKNEAMKELINLIQYTLSIEDTDFGGFEQTFNHILENLLETSVYDELLEKINGCFTNSQRESLFVKIENSIIAHTFVSANFDRVYTLYALLCQSEENTPFINKMMQSGISVFRNNQWQQYYEWANSFVKLFAITADKLDETDLSNFIYALFNFVSPQNRSELVIKSLMYMGEHIPEGETLRAIEYAVNNADTDTTKMDTFEFLKANNKYINEENGSREMYLDFLVNNLSLKVGSFLDEIYSTFSYISKEELINLIKNIINLNEDRLQGNITIIQRVTGKFYSSLESAEDKLETLNELLQGDVEAHIINNILLKSIEKSNVGILLNQLIDYESSTDRNYKQRLLEVSSKYHQVLQKNKLTNLIIDVLRESDDDYIKDICSILINGYSNYRFGNEKRHISNQIVPTFRNVNLETKERVLDVAKSFGMEKDFEQAIADDLLSVDEQKLVTAKFNMRAKGTTSFN